MKNNILNFFNRVNTKTIVTVTLIIFIVYFLFKLISCNPIGTTRQYLIDQEGNEYRLVVIDDCEYISTHVQGGRVLTHKGNCKNH